MNERLPRRLAAEQRTKMQEKEAVERWERKSCQLAWGGALAEMQVRLIQGPVQSPRTQTLLADATH
jgi:hypothetical protein